MTTKRNVIISIPLVWCIRNFLLSGIAHELESDFDLYFAVPVTGKKYMISVGIPEDKLLLLKSQRHSKMQRYCAWILREAHRMRFPTASDKVFAPLTTRNDRSLKTYIIKCIALAFRLTISFRLLERINNRAFLYRIDPSLIERVRTINPKFGLSTAYVVDTEWPLFRLLGALKIRIYTHILSFDNLTSRGYLPISSFDKFLVWNEKMARELKTIYKVGDDRVVLTGTPQFDFHTAPQYVRSREWTHEKLGISSERYLVYCANHYSLTPDEPELVSQIVLALAADPVFLSCQIVLRLHPMDDYDRWNELLKEFPTVRVSYPWSHNDKSSLFWGEPTLNDLMVFSNTLRYADLVFNIASTISIDAAILDRPVVCIGFSSGARHDLTSLYYNFHYSDHYATIMKTGATPIATDIGTLIALSLEAIQYPLQLAEQRRQMVKLLCGEIDGLASDRIIKCLRDSTATG